MDKKKQSEKILEIIRDYKQRSNKELISAMDFIKEDFEFTKDSLIKLTHHIDKLEETYNVILEEYEKRIKGNGSN